MYTRKRLRESETAGVEGIKEHHIPSDHSIKTFILCAAEKEEVNLRTNCGILKFIAKRRKKSFTPVTNFQNDLMDFTLFLRQQQQQQPQPPPFYNKRNKCLTGKLIKKYLPETRARQQSLSFASGWKCSEGVNI